ncbi:hypothetical protein SDC9_97953 [bioreactor metagenome]|uniref:Uncharacterized protein n=1 Tax=bioreactor metagenome TaxID=1076179 RepID=A0A645AE19_9ZZZZ
MVCSEDAWVISTTFIFALANDVKNLAEYPGIPTIPLPSREMSAMFLLPEMPRMEPLLYGGELSIIVEAPSGSNVFLTIIGIPLLTAGWIVGG